MFYMNEWNTLRTVKHCKTKYSMSDLNISIYEVGPKIAVPDKEVQIVYLYYIFEFP